MAARERTLSFAFDLGDFVEHAASPGSGVGLVIQYLLQEGTVMYGIMWRPGDESFHFGHELRDAGELTNKYPDGFVADDDEDDDTSSAYD